MSTTDTQPRLPIEGGVALAIDATDVAAILSSRATAAFVNRRLQQLTLGYRPADDAERPLAHLPHKAHAYLIDALDYLGTSEAGHINPERHAAALKKLEICGALLLAAHDVLSAVTAGEVDHGR